MKRFSILLENLLLTQSRNAKIDHIVNYMREAPDPDRGYALGVMTGALSFKSVKPKLLKDITLEKVDPVLFGWSYDYVGDLAETIALIWPEHDKGNLPSLTAIIGEMEVEKQPILVERIAHYLTIATPTERWALMKLSSGNLRVGVSARLAKTALAQYGGKELEEIERVWHGLSPPYESLFAWLDGKEGPPEIDKHRVFHPMMLSNPIDEEKDFANFDPAGFQAEWKWDGVRVQLVLGKESKAIYSRTGDEISAAFPDLARSLNGIGVLDGELLVGRDFLPMAFNDLQQRLNRKTVGAKMQEQYPPFVRLYDILFDEDEDLRHLPLSERRQRLEAWVKRHNNSCLDVSEIIPFTNWEELGRIRAQGAEEQGHEGVMIKRKDSVYVAGRPKGDWYKWKRDPCLLDAVMMYAQRGHGKRSSFYSDYTFGVWDGEQIVPIGKAYSGFTDAELLQLDKWIRAHTVNRFGPVREVEKALVLEVAFDAAQKSQRHKSGVALRFPRINRIRWDKPAREADTLEAVRQAASI